MREYCEILSELRSKIEQGYSKENVTNLSALISKYDAIVESVIDKNGDFTKKYRMTVFDLKDRIKYANSGSQDNREMWYSKVSDELIIEIKDLLRDLGCRS